MRIGVLGLGFMGSTHLRAMRSDPRAEVVAVCSNDEKKLSGDLTDVGGNLGTTGERFDFSGLRCYSNAAQLYADPRVDAVDVCLPTYLHTEAAIEALRAGKHVLVEKPMALSGSDADRMLDEASRVKRVLMVGQVLRFLPAYRGLIKALANTGPARAAIFRRRCAAPVWSEWLTDPKRSGGGVFDLLIHDVDMCVKLFGVPHAVSASGYQNAEKGVDLITANLHYEKGPAVLVTGGWHHRKAYPFSMEYTVTTDSATYEYDSRRGDPLAYSEDGSEASLPLPSRDGFEAEVSYFLDCCEAGQELGQCPPKESAEAVKLTLLMLQAREQNGERIPCRF